MQSVCLSLTFVAALSGDGSALLLCIGDEVIGPRFFFIDGDGAIFVDLGCGRLGA